MGTSRSLVLFDIDGTLLQRAGPHHRAALIAGIHKVTGLTTNLDGVDTSGMLDRDLIRGMLQRAGVRDRSIQRAMGEIVKACQLCYHESCTHDLRDRLAPGVPAFLKALAGQGSVLGLVTGNLSAIGWKKVELAGVRTFFVVGGFAEDGRTRARLARIAFRRAIRAGLITRNARVALIGDHANDVRAAQEAGFVSVAVATGLMPYEELEVVGPDLLVHDLTELDSSQLL